MKKLILFLAVIGIAFSSCNGKYTIAKRKYNKGFYVSRNNGATTKPESIAKNKPTEKANELIQTEIVTSVNNVKKTEITQESDNTLMNAITIKKIASPNVISKESNNTKTVLANNDKKAVATHKTFKKIEINTTPITTSKKSGSDKEILLIILCIFIPFLAVYIFEDKISTNFWVDLLLCLLFWLPGIIFAFLVCFAGVSL